MNSTLRNLVTLLAVIFVTGCGTYQPVGQPSKSTYDGISGIDTTTHQSRVEARFREDEIVCYRLYKNEPDLHEDCIKRAQKNLQLFSKQEQTLFRTDLGYRKDARKAQAEEQKLEEKRIRANDKSAKEQAKVAQEWVKAFEKLARVKDKYF